MAQPRVWLNGLLGFALAGSFVVASAGDPPATGERTSAASAGPYATVRLPKTAFKGDQPYGAALSLPSRRAVVCYLDAAPGFAKKTKVLLCDVSKGAIVQQSTVNGVFFPFDFDASGKRVLCRFEHGGTGAKDTAEIWTL